MYKPCVFVRPLPADEAWLLGMSMARAWYVKLFELWWRQCLFVLPAFVPLLALAYFSEYRTILLWTAFGLLWLIKPYFEATLLVFVGQKLFGNEQTVRPLGLSALAMVRHRFGTERILALAVHLLEQQQAKPARMRKQLLARGLGRVQMVASLCFWAIELLLWVGFFGLFLQLISLNPYATAPLDWLFELDETPFWVWLAAFLLYALVLAGVMPFFVAGSFGLYVCRRCYLEGWDIELVFRSLGQRLKEHS